MKETKIVSIRAEPDIIKKMKLLEDAKKEKQSEIIKEAINTSFNRMIFESLNEKMFEAIKTIFGKIKIEQFIMASTSKKEEEKKEENIFKKNKDEEKIEYTLATYKLNFPHFRNNSKDVDFYLNRLIIAIHMEPNDLITIRFYQKNIIVGKIDDIDPDILKKITSIIIKKGFKLEAEAGKDKTNYSINFERRADRFKYEMWGKNFYEEMRKIKEIILDISKILKNNKNIKEINRPDPPGSLSITL